MAGAVPVQTQEDLVVPAPAAIGFRLSGVLLAAPVAVATQLVLAGPLGLDLQVPQSLGSSTLDELGLLETTVVVLVISLVGSLTVRLLEVFAGGERGRRIWTTVAVVVLAVSLLLILPLDVSVETKGGLAALLLVVAMVLIPTLSDGTKAAHPVAGGWVANHAAAQAVAAHPDVEHA